MIVGVSLVAFAAILLMSHAPTLNWIIPAAVGSILLLIGIGVLIMELMETWLTRGQGALVDGFQAG
jgi:membrane-bound ClpP family serine protease